MTAAVGSMRKSYIISAIGHAAVLVWSIWSFTSHPLPAPALSQALPVGLITPSELTQISAGSKTAPQAEIPKPLVEKVAEPKPVEDATAKVVEKKEVQAARETAGADAAEIKEAKPQKKATEAKSDPIAEKLAKEESKPDPKKAEAKSETKPEAKPAPKKPPAPKFDPKQVEALLDKRDATRLAAAGETLNTSPSLGTSTGRASQLSMSELDALRARLAQLWSLPAGVKDPQELVVLVRVRLKSDGTLATQPQVLNSGTSPLFHAARDAAIRALYRGQPFTMLRPEHYEQWKDIEITFDPRSMMLM
jgi:membrane protein involved in colicin uptake